MLTVPDMLIILFASLVEYLATITKEADCGGWRVAHRYAQNALSDVVGFSPGENSKSSLYRRLAVFLDEGLGCFARKNPEAFGWVKTAREGVVTVKAIVPAASTAGQAPADPAEEAPDPGAGGTGNLSELSRPKRENSERFLVLRGCFDARRCFRGDRVRCCLGICVVRCERRCRAYACDQRERKGDREHCGRGPFHGATPLMAGGGFATHGTVLPCDICWRHLR